MRQLFAPSHENPEAAGAKWGRMPHVCPANLRYLAVCLLFSFYYTKVSVLSLVSDLGKFELYYKFVTFGLKM